MKYYNNKVIIGIDHGYGNIKTANHIFKAGVAAFDSEPVFQTNMLTYGGKYYLIGEGHKEFSADKITDGEYFILTLAGIAMELNSYGLTEAVIKNVFKRMRGISKEEMIASRYAKELTLRKSNLVKAKADLEREQEKLSKLRAEVIKSIQGESAYSQELLAGLVNETDEKVRELESICTAAEREVEEKQILMKDLSDSYDEIISWSELYDSASLEAKEEAPVIETSAALPKTA